MHLEYCRISVGLIVQAKAIVPKYFSDKSFVLLLEQTIKNKFNAFLM